MKNQVQAIQANQVIQALMQAHQISEAELARQTKLPQTTINRLLLGGTTDPRANTLKPIADFFGVSIGQLCGFEPLSMHQMAAPKHQTSWRFIPIITWEQVKSWRFSQKTINPLTHKDWIGTERLLAEDAFALPSLSFMEPRFHKHSVLLIDTGVNYRDGHYVIIALDGIHPTVRKILVDGPDTWLKSFEETQAPLKLNDKEHLIYGTIVESRLGFYHD